MEIHRRGATVRPLENSGSPDKTRNENAPTSSTRRVPTVTARPVNPYTSSSYLADTILIRMIQIIFSLLIIWFIYIIVAVDVPSTTEDQHIAIAITNAHDSRNLRKPTPSTSIDLNSFHSTRHEIELIKQQFYLRYGGEAESKAMLRRGVRTFENKENQVSSKQATSNRFLQSILKHESSSASTKPQFIMSFAGYSVTVGRGNHWSQSYPFVMESILQPILEMSPLNIQLTVRNSAIGGIPSFPYGWCLANFLGKEAHSVSWDYGMNEGNGASGLESYVRQSLMMPNSPPLFILLDTKKPRLELLQKYTNLGILPDPIALEGKVAVSKQLLALPEKDRPEGLQKWDEWGAPKGAPGQSPWHPKRKEHELMGWMLAIHMLEAVDLALDIMEKDPNWRAAIHHSLTSNQRRLLPTPTTDMSRSGAESMLNGSPLPNDASSWQMNKVSCRTSFLPNISGNFDSIVESGVTKDEDDMLETRADSLFQGGWVFDVGKLERDTKIKVQKYGGLGYIDMKTALYGIPSSGTVKLFLPYESDDGSAQLFPKEGEDANKYFNSIVLCEVNEKRGDNECKMISDLDFNVGGCSVPDDHVSQVKGVASYLKKDICIRVDIPKNANISTKDQNVHSPPSLGVTLEVKVVGIHVTREGGACSISHVIWENYR